jgi:hypothetical protein
MRWLRVAVLVAGVIAGSGVVAAGVRGPVLEGWRLVSDPDAPASPVAGDVASLVLGCCALLLAVAWCWLAVAVITCTWEALAPGTSEATTPSVLRPRLVRAAVAACLGASAFGSPVARAQSSAAGEPSGARAVAVSARPPAAGQRILAGLPVPDRTPGDVRHRAAQVEERPAVTSSQSAQGRPGPVRSVEVGRGDSLWSLTAGLLPTGAPLEAVATAWPLLYAANRAVIGEEPDLLRPGQTLRVGPALTRLLQAARPADPAPTRDAGGPP